MGLTMKDMYSVMLRDYPDLMDIHQMSKALGVNTNTCYKLLRDGKVTGMKVGRTYRIPKVHLHEQRHSFEIPLADQPASQDGSELFADYLQRWLQIARSTIAVTTYASYGGLLRNPIDPWFRSKRIKLKDLTTRDIQAFYVEQGKRVKPNTIHHYHAVIHRALKYAVKADFIPVNPADKVDRPKKNIFTADYYTEHDIEALFAAMDGQLIEVPVKLAAFYGLRRSEVLGLRWDAINFDENTISIQHTVTGCNVDGKHTIIAADTTKTKSSRRTLPLVPSIRDMLLKLRERQKQQKKLCGHSYCKEYDGYICINEIGERIKPAYLSNCFSRTLKQHGLWHVRFHDLRHSSASLLLKQGVSLKQIQEWLGHSDFSTTANIYAHLDITSKQQSAETMEAVMQAIGSKESAG